LPVPAEPTEPDAGEQASAPQSGAAASQPAPVASSVSTAPAAAAAGLADSVTLAPGEVRTVTIEVVDATRYSFIVLGEGVEGSIRTAGGPSYPLYAFGGYSANYPTPSSPETGTVTLTVRNTGSSTRAVPYAFSFARAGSPLSIFASGTGSPDIELDANTGIPGLTGQARLIAGDGTSMTLPMAPIVAGSSTYRALFSGLAPGYYLLEATFTIDGVVHQRIMTGRAAALETTPPVVEYTTVPAASNASGWFRRAVTVTLAASDPGAGVWRVFHGLDTTVLEPVYTSTVTVPITTEGIHTLSYYAEDLQYNASGQVDRTIRIDLTAPVVTVNGLEDGQQIEQDAEVTVDYDCSDALSGIVECRGSAESGEALDTSTPGVFTYSVVGADRAGNDTRVEYSYTVLGVDTTAPSLDIEFPDEPASGWHTEPVTLHFNASDLESGVSRIRWEYGTGSGVVIGSSEQSTGELELTRTGVYTVEVWAEDNAGNRTETQTHTVRVDLDAPSIELVSPEDPAGILPNGHYAQHERVVIDFACDDRGSGVDACDATTPAGELLPTGTPGTHELRIVATDVAGNRTERVLSYTVDAAAGPGAVPTASRDPRLAQTGAETVIPGIILVAVLLAAGAMLLTTRRLGGR
jgi:PKD repeat protein